VPFNRERAGIRSTLNASGPESALHPLRAMHYLLRRRSSDNHGMGQKGAASLGPDLKSPLALTVVVGGDQVVTRPASAGRWRQRGSVSWRGRRAPMWSAPTAAHRPEQCLPTAKRLEFQAAR
jgi:hypothetical protein